MKKCGKCENYSELSNFYTKKGVPVNKCKDCVKIEQKKYYENNKDKLLEKSASYRNANKDKLKEYRDWYKEHRAEKLKETKANEYQKNKKRYSEYSKKWVKDNREKRLLHQKTYRENNKHVITEIENRRRTPKECKISKEYSVTMRDFYKNCPKGYEVDHIIPLVHNNVCGLHVPWNLQYLTVSENRRKSNKLYY